MRHDMYQEYQNFVSSRMVKFKTIFCDFQSSKIQINPILLIILCEYHKEMSRTKCGRTIINRVSSNLHTSEGGWGLSHENWCMQDFYFFFYWNTYFHFIFELYGWQSMSEIIGFHFLFICIYQVPSIQKIK